MFQVSGLHVSYGQSEVIHGLDLTANNNETIAVMGRNGMGKTTLFKALMGVLPSGAGSITIDGNDVTKKENYERVASGLAYVPQGRMIFSNLTVQRKHRDRPGEFIVAPGAGRYLRIVPGIVRDASSQGRQSVRRSAAAIGHCPSPGHRSQSVAARRADRRYSAVDHQGHRQGPAMKYARCATSPSSSPSRC